MTEWVQVCAADDIEEEDVIEDIPQPPTLNEQDVINHLKSQSNFAKVIQLKAISTQESSSIQSSKSSTDPGSRKSARVKFEKKAREDDLREFPFERALILKLA